MARGAAGLGELAGLPEEDELLDAAEQAGEAGDDEGVQGGHHPAMGDLVQGFGADAGDLAGQWGWMN